MRFGGSWWCWRARSRWGVGGAYQAARRRDLGGCTADCVGCAIAYRNSRGRIPEDVSLTRGGYGGTACSSSPTRPVGGRALLDEIINRCAGSDTEILVVTPALASSRAAHWTSQIDEAIELARQRMELSVIESSSRLH